MIELVWTFTLDVIIYGIFRVGGPYSHVETPDIAPAHIPSIFRGGWFTWILKYCKSRPNQTIEFRRLYSVCYATPRPKRFDETITENF